MWSALVLAAQIVAAIQVHGNTATPDAEIRRLSGIEVGATIEDTTVEEVAARLKATKRFENVQVLKRFASIADPSRILIVIIVDEGAVHIEMTGDQAQPTKVVRNRGPRLLFLPVISAEDGYGATYGALVARPGVAGANSRLAFPLTWGGEKKAGVELEKRMPHAPIDRVTTGASITRRTNPLFEQDDDRQRVWVRAEREIVRSVRVGATAGWQHVTFGTADDRFADAGADVTLDTRVDPGLPRNAVYARAMWERTGPTATGHSVMDARGYLGLFHQNVLAVRALRDASNGSLPLYLLPLLGGMDNLRGFRAGTAAGDNLTATSAELIVPLTSPMNIGKVGVSAFVDAGTVYNHGERFADQTLKQGVGGSVWFSAAFLHFNVAVAHGRGSSTRVHAGGSITF